MEERRTDWCRSTFDPRYQPWNLTYSLGGAVIIAAYIEDVTAGNVNWLWYTIRKPVEGNAPIPYDQRAVTFMSSDPGMAFDGSSYVPICKPQHEYQFSLAVWSVRDNMPMLEKLSNLPRKTVELDTLLQSAGDPTKTWTSSIPRFTPPPSPSAARTGTTTAAANGNGGETTKGAARTTVAAETTTLTPFRRPVEISSATENLLENTDGVLQLSRGVEGEGGAGGGAPHQCSLSGVAACGLLFMLTCATLMTSSHSAGRAYGAF